jgi:hypothetical protein
MYWYFDKDITEDYRNLHTEQLHNLYLPNISITESRKMQWAEYVTCTEKMRNVCKILVMNPKRKKEREDVDWIHLAPYMVQQRTLVKMTVNHKRQVIYLAQQPLASQDLSRVGD